MASLRNIALNILRLRGVINIGADATTVSHEARYRWIYALSNGELARHAITLRSKRTRRANLVLN